MKRRGGPASSSGTKSGGVAKRPKTSDSSARSPSKPTNSRQQTKNTNSKKFPSLDDELDHGVGAGASALFDEPRANSKPLHHDDSDDSSESENADEIRLRQGKEYLYKLTRKSKNDSQDEEESEMDSDDLTARLQEDALNATGKMTERRSAARLQKMDGTKLEIRYLRGHQLAITAVRISDDETTIYTASKDCNIVKWDMASGKKLAVYRGKRNDTSVTGHSHHIFALALTSDGKFLASGGKDKQILIWNTEKNDVRDGFAGHKDAVTALAFRLGSHDLYSGSSDRTLKLWNVDEMAYLDTLFGHKAEITAIDSLTRERCVTSGLDKTASVWKIPEEVHLEFAGPKAPLDAIAMLTEDLFVSGGQDGSIQLWSALKRKPLHEVKGAHGRLTNETINWITAVGALRYSDLFATGSGTGEIILWKVNENKDSFSKVLKIPMPGIINCLQFAKSGKYLLAGIGQEPRLGRWVRLGDVKNATAIISLQ